MRSRASLKVLFRLLSQQPQLLALLTRSLLRKHVSVEYDRRFKNGWSAAPRQISLKITNRCNLRCKMCGQWGEAGYNHNRDKADLNREVPLEVYQRMVDEVSKSQPFFYIWGGEPFLYSDILPLLDYIKAHNLVTTVVTNGYRLKDNAADLVRMGLEGLMVSLDGPEEVHNEIRGSKQSYGHLMDGLAVLREEREKSPGKLPYIVVLITVSRDNMGQLVETFEEAEKAGADLVIGYYSWFTNEEIGQRQVQVFEKHLDTTPTSWRGYVLPYMEINGDLVARQVQEIGRREWSFPYMFLPKLKHNQIPAYYADPAETFDYKSCAAPWLMAEIMPDGDVSFCRDYPDYTAGNLMDNTLMEIWNNERARKFRNTLNQLDSFPICSRCCGLMGF